MFFGKKVPEVQERSPAQTRAERIENEDRNLRKYVVRLLGTEDRFVSIYVGGSTDGGMSLQEKMQTALSVISANSSVASVQPFVEYRSSHAGDSGLGYSTAYLLVTREPRHH
jgi:hypothetical protein